MEWMRTTYGIVHNAYGIPNDWADTKRMPWIWCTSAAAAAAAATIIIIIIIIAFVSQLAFRFRMTFGVFIILCRKMQTYGDVLCAASHNGERNENGALLRFQWKSRRPMGQRDETSMWHWEKSTLAIFTCRITQFEKARLRTCPNNGQGNSLGYERNAEKWKNRGNRLCAALCKRWQNGIYRQNAWKKPLPFNQINYDELFIPKRSNGSDTDSKSYCYIPIHSFSIHKIAPLHINSQIDNSVERAHTEGMRVPDDTQ